MKARVMILPVSGGPDGRSYMRVEQSVRRPPMKYRSHHLALAYIAGLISATVSIGIALLG